VIRLKTQSPSERGDGDCAFSLAALNYFGFNSRLHTPWALRTVAATERGLVILESGGCQTKFFSALRASKRPRHPARTPLS
jgi:hypothetical protein